MQKNLDQQHMFVSNCSATTNTKLPERSPVVTKMTHGESHKVKGEVMR